MKKNTQFFGIRKERKALKAAITKMKKAIPGYLVGFIFSMVLIVNALEDTLYTYFGGSIKLFKISALFTVFICIIYLCIMHKKITDKEKIYRETGAEMHEVMKLEKQENE